MAVRPISEAEFDAIVRDALDEVPSDLLAMLDNVVFLVEEEPPADEPDLLGIYEGTPLTDRGEL
ncbi:MAG: metallopeptidase family protein, partial [Phycicoccus sp.]